MKNLIGTFMLAIVFSVPSLSIHAQSYRNVRSGSYQRTHQNVSNNRFQTPESRARQMAEIRMNGARTQEKIMQEKALKRVEKAIQEGHFQHSTSCKDGKTGTDNNKKGCSKCIQGIDRQGTTVTSTLNWLAYHNNAGELCPYCPTQNYTSHNHLKCAHCNTPTH